MIDNFLVLLNQYLKTECGCPSGKGSHTSLILSTLFSVQAQSPIGSFSWYEQGWGSKEVELTPADMCHKECFPVLVTLHAGDIRECHSELVST